MEFGYHNTSFDYGSEPAGDGLLEHARFLEDAGFEWFTLMDHLWQLRGIGRRDEPFLECYAGLSAVAAATDTMELSALVTCVHYRNPGYLAKLVASLDALSGGRAALAIGAGWYEDEYEAIGVEFPEPATRIKQLRDAVRLCRAAWTEDSPVDYDGEYYSLEGFYLDPKPDGIPVLVGGAGEQLTLRVVAEYADRWNIPGADHGEYEHKLDVLREHCADLGTDFDAIAKTTTQTATIRGTTEAAHEAYEELKAGTERGVSIPRDEHRGLVGTPAEVAEAVAAYRDLGVDALQIDPPRNDRETIERFADEVLPQF